MTALSQEMVQSSTALLILNEVITAEPSRVRWRLRCSALYRFVPDVDPFGLQEKTEETHEQRASGGGRWGCVKVLELKFCPSNHTRVPNICECIFEKLI